MVGMAYSVLGWCFSSVYAQNGGFPTQPCTKPIPNLT